MRVREVEEQMTDDERFSLIVSLKGEYWVIQLARDGRIPRGDTHELGLHAWRAAPGVPVLSNERLKPRCH